MSNNPTPKEIASKNTMATWAWNTATDYAIELIREILREENSPLNYEAASIIQQRLHEQKLG
jgi:ferritin-like metal-binding protein YciE